MQQRSSKSRVVALVVIPAVASSVGTYAITRAMYERAPVRAVRAVAPVAAPLSLDAYAFPGAQRRGMSRAGDLETREYETDASVGKVARHYRQELAPDVRLDYSRMPLNGSFSASRSTPGGGSLLANGRVKVDARGSGSAVFFRRDAAGTLTIAALGHAGEKTTIVTSYAPAGR